MLLVWIILFLTAARAELFLYDKAILANATNLAPRCIEAMSSSIACDPSLLRFASVGYVGSIEPSFLSNTLCQDSCVSSLTAYRERVLLDCSTVDAWPGMPATYNGDFVQAYQNQTCLKGSSGEWCNNFFDNLTELQPGQKLEDLPTAELCSSCMIAFLKQSQSSSFSNYDDKMADSWKKIQSLCSIKIGDTSIPRAPTSNERVPFGEGFGLNTTVRVSDYEARYCYSQQMYTTVEGDTCASISEKMSVATGALEILNGLYADCSNLVSNKTLCLPRTCKTHRVQKGDTCQTIRKAHQLGFGKLIYYNPTVNEGCTNLIDGDYICLSPPAGYPSLRVIPDIPSTASMDTIAKQAADTASVVGSSDFVSLPESQDDLTVLSAP